MRIYKLFAFEACHSLGHLPAAHKCSRMHGHSYRVRVEVEGEPNEATGFVIDYAELAEIFDREVYSALDHQCVDDHVKPSTSENLARWIYDRMEPLVTNRDRYLFSVEVGETATAGAVYQP